MALSVIVPAADSPPTLDRCVEALRCGLTTDDELIVVDKPLHATATVARNAGAARARADILVFVDADVEVHGDAFEKIRVAFAGDSTLAAVFGSYDDSPEGGVVGGFRNLLHHYVHQNSGGPIATFWAGLGAMRRDVFEGAGGFVEHPVEDIELGMRLTSAGAKIVLDPGIQGKHLKNWSLWSMIRTDFAVRGVPWVGLMMRYRNADATLNVGWRHRLSALACVTLVGAVLLGQVFVAAGALLAVIVLNAGFYAMLSRRRGLLQAAAGVLLHVVHQLVAVTALPVGLLAYARDSHGVRASARTA